MIRGLAIGSVVGCLLAVLFVDLDAQVRATSMAAIRGMDKALRADWMEAR